MTQSTDILIKQITDDFLAELKKQVTKQVVENVSYQLSRLDIPSLAREHISNVLNDNTKTYSFPNRSIKGSAIDPDGLYVRADQIAGGTMRNFESTGIQDKSTETQVTIMDNATVFENQLVSKELHVAGNAVIEGDLKVSGSVEFNESFVNDVIAQCSEKVRLGLNDGLFNDFTEQVFDRINTEGISADNLKYLNQPLVSQHTLAPNILNSNLQKVGVLKELQVIGESLLDETLYVSTNRVGVNTLEPEATVDIWDQEVQITIGKLEKDFGIISMPRAQTLVLGVNKNYNLSLLPDGSVAVNELKIGATRHSSSDSTPTASNPPGSIVWNSSPEIGAPIGWVSLGGARWAEFGQING